MSVRPVDNVYFGAHLPRKQKDMKQPDKNNPRPSDVQLVEQALAAARPWGLEAEVMWSAMTHYNNAALGASMEESLDAALDEWDIDQDHPLTKWDEGQMYNIDAKVTEPHRGLEIGEDGTVNKLI